MLTIPNPNRKAIETGYEATVVSSDTNKGATSFERRSILRRYVLSRVNFSEFPSAITVTQSLSIATDIPIVANFRTQPQKTMTVNSIQTRS